MDRTRHSSRLLQGQLGSQLQQVLSQNDCGAWDPYPEISGSARPESSDPGAVSTGQAGLNFGQRGSPVLRPSSTLLCKHAVGPSCWPCQWPCDDHWPTQSDQYSRTHCATRLLAIVSPGPTVQEKAKFYNWGPQAAPTQARFGPPNRVSLPTLVSGKFRGRLLAKCPAPFPPSGPQELGALPRCDAQCDRCQFSQHQGFPTPTLVCCCS
jgi:hypothetical protein